MSPGAAEGVMERVLAALRAYAEGVHQLGEPAAAMDADLPDGVRAVWQAMDGAELFHGELVLYPRAAWTREAGKLHVGELGEDELWVALEGGALWRLEESTGEWIEEGSSAEKWLSGWVDAEALIYDREGEFQDGAIDEEGELTPETEIARAKAVLKRDRKAAAPRWRLARALARGGKTQAARDELEELVAAHPRFAWAWYDLARASEALGEIEGAREEAVAAADADPGYEHAGFFLAWAARLAALAGDEAARGALAGRALAAEGRMAQRQLEGARSNLEAGDVVGARELCEVALALAPRDVGALDLMKQIEAAAGGKKRSRAARGQPAGRAWVQREVRVLVIGLVGVMVIVIVPRVASADREEEPFALYVEALGRGGAGGLGGEIAIRKRVAVGATVGFMPADGERVTTFSPYLHLVLLARGAHAWFADAGPAVTHRSIPSPVPEWDGVSETSFGAIAGSGYELSGERLFLRSSVSVAVGPGGVAPWGGVALGVRF